MAYTSITKNVSQRNDDIKSTLSNTSEHSFIEGVNKAKSSADKSRERSINHNSQTVMA